MTKAKRTVLFIFVFSLITTVIFSVLTCTTNSSLCYTLAITFGTILYHFAMRLIVGNLVGHNFDYKSYWFRPKRFEEKFYKAIRVKKWKSKMPTYNSDGHLAKNESLIELVNTMCRNEVIHEIIALLSFVPILFSLFADTLLVFVITSIIACLYDLIFVIMQRYNRPRVVRIMERWRKI